VDSETIIFGVFLVPPAAWAVISPYSTWEWQHRSADADPPSDRQLRSIRLGGMIGILVYAATCVLNVNGYL
jgi:hypothetical protein